MEKTDGTVVLPVEPERFEFIDSACESNSGPSKNIIVRLLESGYLGEAARSDHFDDGEEMKDMDGCVKIIQSPQSAAEEGFDVCREYSYSSDEEEESSSYFQRQQTIQSSKSTDENVRINVLGRIYHPITDYAVRRDDERSLLWFTYRSDFPEIAPYGITSDAGWGCMLRSAMMLLAQALRMHYKGRDWNPPLQLHKRRQDPFFRSLLTWFADFPSADSSIYSLHNMVAAGLDRQVLPGEWYGPGTATYILRDLVELQERRQTQSKLPQKADGRIFRVHVAADACLYKSAVEELMTRDSKTFLEQERARLESANVPLHPLDNTWECEWIQLESTIEWDTALLLLIPLRLGLKSFNPAYLNALAQTFSLHQSVGVLGGRPRGARWFYGAAADGSKIFGLDPHTVQTAPRKRSAIVNGEPSLSVDLSDDYLQSVHTTYPEALPLSKMDPSIALGFYCKDRKDFQALLSGLSQSSKEHPNMPDLFSVCNTVPDYSAHGSLITDMASPGLNDSMLCEDVSVASDEDEYVVL